MSHSEKEEQREQYLSIQDQVKILKEDIESLQTADDWAQVHEAIAMIKKRILYMEEQYGD